MAQRLTIGLPFNLDSGWMGGAYYFYNLLSALAMLKPDDQPDVCVITFGSESYEFLANSGYKNLSISNGEHISLSPHHAGIDILFAYTLPGLERYTLSWVPDFQERHLPYLFTQAEIDGRTAWHNECLQTAGVLLSSASAYTDLDTFYDVGQTPVFVVPFATFLPDHRTARDELTDRYALPARYFFSPNQFWVHKNHVVILAALRDLAQRDVFPHVCFSGREQDSRADGYADYLRALAREWGLEQQVHFLGFLPREDQVSVLDEAIAVIQPSRFEGWSTVVEDSKACSQHVIASNLDVHHEQLPESTDFFEPSDHRQLAAIMERFWLSPPSRQSVDYSRAQRAFGEAFLGVARAVARSNPRRAGGSPGIEADGGGSDEGRRTFAMTARAEHLRRLLGIGWSQSEDTHTWSLGPRAELWLNGQAAASRIVIRLSGNPHVPGGRQQVTLSINGEIVDSAMTEHGGRFELAADCRGGHWQVDGINRLALDIDRVAMPPEHTGDTRLLGVCIWELEFLEATD